MADDLLTHRGTMKMIPGAAPGGPHPHLRVVQAEPAVPPALVVPPPVDAIHHSSRRAEPIQGLAPGDRVGPYLAIRLLGEGGFSYVWEVSHVHKSQSFALKFLNAEARQRPRFVERFVGEAKVLSFLSAHPHVVRVHEVGDDPRVGPYVVMEKLGGKTLRGMHDEILRRGERMHPQVALFIILKLARALHDVHALAIVHRDMKPENVQIVPQAGWAGFDVKILDWGASLNTFNPATSASESIVATPPYMSPEQAKRQRATAASDQYSLAHMIWELFMGRHAFADAMEESGGRADLVVLWQVAVAIRSLPPAVAPAGLAQAVERAFSKEPRDRWPSMQAFADELQKHVEKDKGQTPLSIPARSDAKPYRPTVLSTYRKPGQRDAAPLPAPVHEVRCPKRVIDVLELVNEPSLVVLVPKELHGHRVLLGDEGVVGRTHDQADILFDHHTVSNRHARFRRVIEDDGAPVYALEDLSSLNGCFIGSSKDIAAGLSPVHGVAPIKAYDVIGFGDVVALLVPAGGFKNRDLSGFAPMYPPREDPDDPKRVLPPLSRAGVEAAAPTHPGSTQEPGHSAWVVAVIVLSSLVIVYFGAALALQSYAGITLPPLPARP